jgi:outer membrane protein OmpA-like peptidoglycan-associated protein
MAENPGKILAALGLPADQVRITYLPYLSQDSDIVELRVDQTLAGRPKTLRHQFDWTTNTLTLRGRAPLGWVLTAHDSLRSLPGLRAVLIEGLVDPETEVTIDLGRDRILRLTGQVSLGWREAVKEKVQNMSGIGGLDLSLLKDDADSRAIKLLLNRVNSVAIFFPLNQDRPIEADRPRLLQAVDDLVALEKLARPMGLTVSLTIYGYTDISGRVTRNYELSQARARALAALLYERGSTISLTTFGLGPDPAALAQEDDRKSRTEKKEAAQASRRIELKARLDRARLTLNLQ